MNEIRRRQRPNDHAKRAQHYLWQDGIFEILIGFGSMFYALFMIIQAASIPHLPIQDENWRIIASVLSVTILTFGAVLGFRLISGRIKESLVYPRTGFVELRPPKRDITPQRILLTIPLSLIVGFITLAVILGIMVLFAQLHINISLVLYGTMIAGPAAILAQRNAIKRLYAVAIGIVLISVLLTVGDVFGTIGMILLYAFTGVLLCLSGSSGLWVYLRQNQITEED